MFFQVITGRVADRDEIKAAGERWLRDLAPGAIGWLGTTSGVTEDDMFVGVARFTSVADARRNAERPEQHQWWMETSKLFTGEVAFHDCRDAGTWLGGGSDEAGFVQMMQGHVRDRARIKQLWDELESALGAGGPMGGTRPDIIGGTHAMDDDGFTTETAYFTSEEDARAGEKTEPPPELRPLMEEERSLFTELVYHNLPEPWLHSPR